MEGNKHLFEIKTQIVVHLENKNKETQKLYPIRTGQKSGALRRSSWQENSQGASSRRPGTETPSYQPRDVRSHLLLAGE